MSKSEIESWVADVAGHTKPAAVHCCKVDPESWLAEVQQNEAFLTKLGDRVPPALWKEHRALHDRLRASIS